YVTHGVNGRRNPFVRASGRALGVTFLDVGTVGQHDPKQVRCRCGCVYGAAEAVPDKLWQQATVIDMGVGEQDEVDRGGIESEICAIPCRRIASTLDHSAIDEKPRLRRFHKEAGAGDLACPSQELDLHTASQP